jgi:Tfp pilus assembly protein PilF
MIWILGLLLVLSTVAIGLYSNSAHHTFHLDDSHSITENPALRSLDQVPAYFTDAHTFSTLLTNADYRPVLQLSYALNYAMAGYQMPAWHWTQVAIHICCAFFLCLFTLELLKLCQIDDRERLATAVLASLVFLVHPTGSGVVNYTSARSSELTAAFLLTAFTLDLRNRRWVALVFYLAALFTKVEAVAALAVFWGLSLLRQRAAAPANAQGGLARALARPSEWAPYLVAVAVYFGARHLAMEGIDFAGSAAAADMTRGKYLCTQITAWWVYLFQWLCPLNLVADNMTYPIFSSPLQPAVTLALLGWGLVALGLWSARKVSPHFAFLAFSALALISPTSSVVPLSEMMNEHRPYLPVALVSVIAISGLVRWALALGSRERLALGGLILLWLGCLANLTWQRNRVFLTADSYWEDVVRKAPSGRAHNNYGLTLMQAGRMPEAQHHFEQSLKLAPQYSTAHINLAIIYVQAGRLKDAQRHYDLAVLYDRGAGEAQMWRGSYFLGRGEYQKAEADFLHAAKVSNDRYRVHAGLAHAYAGLGQPDRSAQNTLAAGAIDFPRISRDIVALAGPYFRSDQQAEKGLLYFAALEKAWPEAWWVHTNQASLLERLGRTEQAKAKRSLGDQLKGY